MPRAAESLPAFTSLVGVQTPRVVPGVRRHFSEIKSCRICGNEELAPVLSMGRQSLTGVFHKTQNAPLTSGPLELVACNSVRNRNACGLVQLRQTYDLNEMYVDHYGYRSSLNRTMVNHLQAKVSRLLER